MNKPEKQSWFKVASGQELWLYSAEQMDEYIAYLEGQIEALEQIIGVTTGAEKCTNKNVK